MDKAEEEEQRGRSRVAGDVTVVERRAAGASGRVREHATRQVSADDRSGGGGRGKGR